MKPELREDDVVATLEWLGEAYRLSEHQPGAFIVAPSEMVTP